MDTPTEEALNQVFYNHILEIIEQLTFQKLCQQIKNMPIDNAVRLSGLVDLIYDKAMNEFDFLKTAALMTTQLAGIKVPANDPKDPHKTINFLEFTFNRCQMEFEKNWTNGKPLHKKMKDLAQECTDLTNKKELLLTIEKEEQRFKIKALGNIRFVGELFNQSILSPKVVVSCMLNLLKNTEDDSLECLCELVTAVGEKLENSLNISVFFIKMQEILDTHAEKISSSTRRMLEDVIQLRNSNWVPCNTPDLEAEAEPQKKADGEQINIDTLKSNPDEKTIDYDNTRSNNQLDNNTNGSTAERLKLPPIENITLGSRSLFEQWAQGSNMNIHMATYSVKTNYSSMMADMCADLHENKMPPENKEKISKDVKKEDEGSK